LTNKTVPSSQNILSVIKRRRNRPNWP